MAQNCAPPTPHRSVGISATQRQTLAAEAWVQRSSPSAARRAGEVLFAEVIVRVGEDRAQTRAMLRLAVGAQASVVVPIVGGASD